MSRFTKTKLSKAIFSRRRWLGGLKFGSASFNVLLAGFIFSAMVGYLAQANLTVASGFKMRDAEAELSLLQEKNKALELRSAEAQSIARLEEVAADLKMIKVGKVDYIKSGIAAMAAR